jgi:hypothetical protein
MEKTGIKGIGKDSGPTTESIMREVMKALEGGASVLIFHKDNSIQLLGNDLIGEVPEHTQVAASVAFMLKENKAKDAFVWACPVELVNNNGVVTVQYKDKKATH